LQVTIVWYALFTFLCGFAQDFNQLFVLRAMQGFGFGGEWAAGAVLMGEVVRDKYRGRAVGLVQTGWAIGWGAAAIVYTALYWLLPEWLAWRVLFGVGLVPAVFVFWVRRHIDESDLFHERAAERAKIGASHLFAAFRSPHMWTTIKVSLMVAGAQGGGYAVSIWMPTYLRTVRGLSPTSTGGFLIVQILGALVGFLIGSYLADFIGRKGTFIWSAVASFVMVLVFLLLPMDNTVLFWVGIPLNIVLLMKFPPMGPFMTELYPTDIRGTGQGFCYNAGRALGSVFPTMVGYLSQILTLGTAIAICSASAFGLMILMLLLLPETRGRTLDSLEPVPAGGN
jgi:MFS family permease